MASSALLQVNGWPGLAVVFFVILLLTSCFPFFPSFFLLLRPFLTQAVGIVSRKRPFSTEAQIGLSYTVEKGLFRLNFFRLNFPTGSASRKTQSKKFYTCFLFLPVASLIPPQQTHTHTPIPGTTQQYHTTTPTLPWLSLLLLLAASQRGALLAPLSISVYHTTAVARVIDAVLPLQLRLLYLWRLSAECNATNVVLVAFG